MQAFSHSLREVLDRLNDANSEKKSIDEECQKQITEKTKLELAVKDLDRTVKDDRTLKVISWGSTGSSCLFPDTTNIVKLQCVIPSHKTPLIQKTIIFPVKSLRLEPLVNGHLL